MNGRRDRLLDEPWVVPLRPLFRGTAGRNGGAGGEVKRVRPSGNILQSKQATFNNETASSLEKGHIHVLTENVEGSLKNPERRTMNVIWALNAQQVADRVKRLQDDGTYRRVDINHLASFPGFYWATEPRRYASNGAVMHYLAELRLGRAPLFTSAYNADITWEERGGFAWLIEAGRPSLCRRLASSSTRMLLENRCSLFTLMYTDDLAKNAYAFFLIPAHPREIANSAYHFLTRSPGIRDVLTGLKETQESRGGIGNDA